MARTRMVFQYDPLSGTGSIPVRGRYTGSPSAIEASWAGAPWVVIDADPEAGVFEGELVGREVGRGLLQVRFAGDSSSIVSIPDVGVGNIVLIAGQSNAVMWLGTLHKSLQGASVVPVQGGYHHPDDPNAVKWADDPIHACIPLLGSVWPELGDRLIVDSGGIPLMFISAAQSGTGLVDPPHWKPGGIAWNTAISQMAFGTAGQRCPALVLWFQGESDAVLGVSQPAYEAGLVAFGDALQDEFSCAGGTPVPIVVGVIGAIDENLLEPGSVTAAQVAEIQNAQRNAPSLRSYFQPGPDTSNGNEFPVFNLHFTDAAYPALLDAWCASIPGISGLTCLP